MAQAYFNLGVALNRLAKAGAVTPRNFLLKHHPSNTGDGFLYRAEAALRVSNDLTEMAVLNGVESVLSMLPLLTASDLETFSPQGFEETFSFFDGLYSATAAENGKKGGQATTEAKRAAAAANGKKGGRPKKQ